MPRTICFYCNKLVKFNTKSSYYLAYHQSCEIKSLKPKRCKRCNEVFKTKTRRERKVQKFCSKSCCSKGRKFSKERLLKMRLSQLGEKSNNWKGNNASISAIHGWLDRNFEKPKKCEHCKKRRFIEWSNNDHKYRRKREDYEPLCRPCHRGIKDKLMRKLGKIGTIKELLVLNEGNYA